MIRVDVKFREEAIADLEDIANYILDNGGSSQVALGFIQRIKTKCEKIGGAPNGSPLRNDLGSGIRVSTFEHSAVIAYRVLPNCVDIVSIFYGGRDYEAIMRGVTYQQK